MARVNRLKKSEYFASDLTAVALGVFLCALLLATARSGVGMSDEGYYYTVAHRLLLGERMIADEWNLAQLVHLLNFLPNALYIKLAGGTEGLILFMRYLFIAINTVFYGWVYYKLRARKLWGVLAAFLFAAVIQQTLLAIAYFTSAPMAVLAVWLLLAADEKKKSPPVLLLTGLIMACGILAEPFLIAIYVLWFALTLAREARAAKRPLMHDYAFILNKRTFLWVTAGAVAMFVPYMLYLIFSGSFEGVGAAIPYLSSGAEYNKDNIVDLEKFVHAAELYGIPFLAGGVAVVIAAAALRIKKITSPRARRAVLLAAGLILAGGYIHAAAVLATTNEMLPWVSFTQYNNLLLLIVSPTLWLLTQKKQPRLFTLWLIGMLFSALVDLSSTVILAAGGGLIRVACVLQLPALLAELTAPEENKKDKKKKQTEKPALRRAYLAALALCGAAAVAWNCGYLAVSTVYKPVEKLFQHEHGPLEYEIDRGPFKGLKTSGKIASVYGDTLLDLDEVKALAGGGPVTVLDLAPYTYLYMDLPYGAYSAWYEFDEPERLAAYWGLRPARQPTVIYIPYYSKNLFERYTDEYLAEKLANLRRFADGPVTEGRAGYILRVTRLRTADDGAWAPVGE